jgi:hypothetical protein
VTANSSPTQFLTFTEPPAGNERAGKDSVQPGSYAVPGPCGVSQAAYVCSELYRRGAHTRINCFCYWLLAFAAVVLVIRRDNLDNNYAPCDSAIPFTQ